MRRPSKNQSLSPQQLKHFAVAAAAITCLLAVFASGSDWGATAQVQAVEARNKAQTAEQQKLGTRKLAANLTSQPASGGGDGGAAGPVGAGDGGGGGSSYSTPAQPMAQRSDQPSPNGPAIDPRQLPTKPGQSVTFRNVPSDQAPGADRQPKAGARRTAATAEERAKISAASAARSGHSQETD